MCHMTLLLLSGDSGTEQDGGEESDEEEGVSEHGGSVEDEDREDEQDEVGRFNSSGRGVHYQKGPS